MESAIQIVAFNIPYPPDYGGVIDVFYKIKALAECGIQVHLHCFEYGREHAKELEKFCVKVFYYPRSKGLLYQLSSKPYIVKTRNNSDLLRNLASNKYPILFEGLHTCSFLDHQALQKHLLLVRTHNIEHEYYRDLSVAESNWFKKLFFSVESVKLSRFESILKSASHLLCISPNDNLYFDRKYGTAHFIPAFHPFNEITSKPGKGKYILFHGNLSVAENVQAVKYLIKNVFNQISHPIIIAGKDPSEQLKPLITGLPHIQLVANPAPENMEHLIRESHICLLPTFQDTGLKLKLLASLFSGRFCIANTPMIHKTSLEHLCYLADTPDEMIQKCNELFELEFSEPEIEKRKLILEDTFSNRHNALKIKKLIQESGF